MNNDLIERLQDGDIVQIGLCPANPDLDYLFLRIIERLQFFRVVSLAKHDGRFGTYVTTSAIDACHNLHALDNGLSSFNIQGLYFKNFFIRDGKKHDVRTRDR